jgi:hypothetical protein
MQLKRSQIPLHLLEYFELTHFSLDIAERLAQAAPVYYSAKASRSERDKGLNGQRNQHPTVKPLSLLIWLCRLLAPPAAYSPRRLLIPFSGSGSECIAASCLSDSWEEVIGIESNPEYVEISRQRLAFWASQHKTSNVQRTPPSLVSATLKTDGMTHRAKQDSRDGLQQQSFGENLRAG